MTNPLLGAPFGVPLVHTDDLDEMVDGMAVMLSRGHVTIDRSEGFLAHVEGFFLPDAAMIRADFGSVRMHSRIAHVEDFVAIVLPVTGAMSFRQKGATFEAEAGSGGFVDTPGDDLIIDLEPDMTHVVIRVDQAILRRAAVRMLTNGDGELDELSFQPIIDSPMMTSAAMMYARMLQSLAPSPAVDGGLDARPEPANPLAGAMLAEQAAGLLLLGQPNSWTELLLRGGRNRAPRPAIQEAAERMAFAADQPLTIERIAREVGLSVRGLHAGFRREFDCSPKQYLTAVRLERARSDLESLPPDVTIAEIAARWGYPHASRFAQVYRRRFGESPSATRHRGPG